MKRLRILVVDDDATAARLYRRSLELLAAQLTIDGSARAVRQAVDERTSDLLVLVHRPPKLDALELLRAVRELDPHLPVVVIDTKPSLATATASIRLGAGDYLEAREAATGLAESVLRLGKDRRASDERDVLRRHVERPYSFDDFIGSSPPMRKVFDTIEQVADSDVDVLVVGPTGTGKELVARAIHRRSPRAEGPFVPVDCGAIPENLLESEFFGHERGAFTGADSRRIGLLEFADGGTFFLDELGELPLLMQAKLLRTLQQRRVRRVGGHEEVDVDVRIVAATARDLDAMVRAGTFRQDLYYRINVVRIDLPPLADRGDDIGLLAEYFANRHRRDTGRSVNGITPEAYQVLKQYHWPGNVRELQNVIRRGIALSQGSMLGLNDLPDEVVTAAGKRQPAGAQGYFQLRDEHVARFERQYLQDLLARHHGDVKSAAVEARLPRGTLYRLMKNHDLDSTDFR